MTIQCIQLLLGVYYNRVIELCLIFVFMCIIILPADMCVHCMCGSRSHLVKGPGNCLGVLIVFKADKNECIYQHSLYTSSISHIGQLRWAVPLTSLQDGEH